MPVYQFSFHQCDDGGKGDQDKQTVLLKFVLFEVWGKLTELTHLIQTHFVTATNSV